MDAATKGLAETSAAHSLSCASAYAAGVGGQDIDVIIVDDEDVVVVEIGMDGWTEGWDDGE